MTEEHNEENGRRRIALDPTISGLVEELVVEAVRRDDGLRTHVQHTIMPPSTTDVSGDYRYDVAIVCSDEHDLDYTRSYVTTLEADGLRVFFPPRDIDGYDPNGGIRTCRGAVCAGYGNGREAHVIWHPKAEMMRFYLGCCFAMGKPLFVINPVKRTDGESFQNFLLDWQRGRSGMADLAIHIVDFDGQIDPR